MCLFQLQVNGQSDTLRTASGQLIISPVIHGSLVLQYGGKTIYIDPYSGGDRYKHFQDPDLILITDIHGDHMDKKTLEELNTDKATFLVPAAVKEQLTDFANIKTLANGEVDRWENITIEAVPMYNLPESLDARHPKGRGNGYIITFEEKRIYISGDTEGIKEMRELKDIDVAFICMNMPYTMDINQAAEAVLDFKPAIVYPYHYRGSDVAAFKKLVENENNQIKVRLREWYN
jgi:L-ascorbate metabolism protein UlaG (beta-lactamase superfamily)